MQGDAVSDAHATSSVVSGSPLLDRLAARPRLVDATVALLVWANETPWRDLVGDGPAGRAWGTSALVIVAAAALLKRRRHPLAVLVAITAIVLVLLGLGWHEPDSLSVPGLVALFTVAGHAPRGRRTGSVALACAMVLTMPPGPWLGRWDAAAGFAAVAGITVAAAWALRGRRERAAADRARERSLLVERQQLAHDVHALTSTLSAVAIGAEAVTAAPSRGSSSTASASASDAWPRVADSARDALLQVSHLVHRLSSSSTASSPRDETASGLEPAPGPSPTRRPARSLDDVAALADRLQAATGVTVELHLADVPDLAEPLPQEVAAAAYAVVEEGLANVIRHRVDAHVQVSAKQTETDDGTVLAVDVVDDGGARARPPRLPPGGHGLAVLRQRVERLGGTLHSGPHSDGGFRLSVRLPAEPRTEATPARSTGARSASGADSSRMPRRPVAAPAPPEA
ncbi:MAG: sensor histidine kinase [Dermatophilaceae bacterium]